MKNKIRAIGLFILLITAIIYFFRRQIIARLTPDAEQSGNVYVNVKKDTAYISTKLIIKNKAPININIDTIKYKVSMYNTIHLQGKQFLNIELPPYGKDSANIFLKVPYSAILEDFKEERNENDSAIYYINILVQYSTIFGKKERALNKQIKIKIPRPPKLIVQDINYKKIQLKNILAEANIKIINPNNIKLSIKEIKYTLNILKQGSVSGKFNEPINIKPTGSTFIELPMEISMNNLGRTFVDILMNNDNYDYTLNINAVLTTDKTNELIHLDLLKTGKMELKK